MCAREALAGLDVCSTICTRTSWDMGGMCLCPGPSISYTLGTCMCYACAYMSLGMGQPGHLWAVHP